MGLNFLFIQSLLPTFWNSKPENHGSPRVRDHEINKKIFVFVLPIPDYLKPLQTNLFPGYKTIKMWQPCDSFNMGKYQQCENFCPTWLKIQPKNCLPWPTIHSKHSELQCRIWPKWLLTTFWNSKLENHALLCKLF